MRHGDVAIRRKAFVAPSDQVHRVFCVCVCCKHNPILSLPDARVYRTSTRAGTHSCMVIGGGAISVSNPDQCVRSSGDVKNARRIRCHAVRPKKPNTGRVEPSPNALRRYRRVTPTSSHDTRDIHERARRPRSGSTSTIASAASPLASTARTRYRPGPTLSAWLPEESRLHRESAVKWMGSMPMGRREIVPVCRLLSVAALRRRAFETRLEIVTNRHAPHSYSPSRRGFWIRRSYERLRNNSERGSGHHDVRHERTVRSAHRTLHLNGGRARALSVHITPEEVVLVMENKEYRFPCVPYSEIGRPLNLAQVALRSCGVSTPSQGSVVPSRRRPTDIASSTAARGRV